jgi:hypothetical protein
MSHTWEHGHREQIVSDGAQDRTTLESRSHAQLVRVLAVDIFDPRKGPEWDEPVAGRNTIGR